MSTPRVRILKESLISTKPEISVERALLITESYGQTEGEPIVIRRAKALSRILSEMSIYILPEEVVVGNMAHTQKAAPVFPEYDVDFLEKELDEFSRRPGDAFSLSQGDREKLKETLP
ncbi:MAG: hypothetical protein OEZ24_06095, partial [Candidatus Bathyarchaeota archaeon]|nr:hypothetical protein [Candidatus Bathyarchaeota archaeon]